MKKIILFTALSFSIFSVFGKVISNPPKKTSDTATFATGCFWCTEAKFKQLKGVKTVVSGFSGGTVAKPTYKQVVQAQQGMQKHATLFMTRQAYRSDLRAVRFASGPYF